ncbi:MAG: hypothetical protein AB1798_08485 [Spirochaetota bacterium]
MVETLESKLRRLEAKAGNAQDEPPSFRIFLITSLKTGFLCKSFRTGKSRHISGEKLGIEQWVPEPVPEPQPVAGIAVEKTKIAVPTRANQPETPEERIARIRELIAQDFGF